MSYRIHYPSIRKIRGREGLRVRLPALTALCFLLFLVLVQSVWPEGRSFLNSALDTMAAHLQKDASVMTALTEWFSLIPS